jgi:DNA topoisomerase-1
LDLLIVESPAKTKTIGGFLGSGYKVMASMGHIRDLPGKELGVDIKNNFAPKYIMATEKNKRENIKRLKEAVSQATIVYLCTDLDREGEAIAWHLIDGLKIPKSKIKRATFSEITKTAVTTALANPRNLDMDLVNAQQARRILDRIVGYKLSPFLWRKLPYKGLSAGRVQSSALKLIVDREKEILAFVPEEYWKIAAMLNKLVDDQTPFKSFLTHIDEAGAKKKFEIKDKTTADTVLSALRGATYTIKDIVRKESSRKPPVPFTTSTLQMEASRKLGFSAEQTMKIAQQLYEGIDFKGQHQALITYMRTDSLNLSDGALAVIHTVVEREYGKQYLMDDVVKYKTKSKGAQEAHEAIRPVDQALLPADIKGSLADDLWKLYDLVWKRTAACQMKPAVFDTTTVSVLADKYYFTAKGAIMKFKGFLMAYEEGVDEKEEDDSTNLPELSENENLNCSELLPEQKYTQPPARFTEATLVKELEKNGVGRPSTYAAILNNIKSRGYVTLEKKRFTPTDVGMAVIDLLDKTFPDITNIGFTAKIEEELDEVAAGEKNWITMLSGFYTPFEANLQTQNQSIPTEHQMPENPVDCPQCGKPMVIKRSKIGQFLGCSDYPNCKQILGLDGKPVERKSSTAKRHPTKTCPLCGGALLERKSKYGMFYGCENFPTCRYTDMDESKKPAPTSTGIVCPKCKVGEIVERKTKKGSTFWGCGTFPKCDYATWDDPAKNKS